MSKLMIATALVCMIGSVHMQQQVPQLNGNLPTLGQGNGLLGGNYNQNGSGPLSTLLRLPQRGMEMIGHMFSGLRNMLPSSDTRMNGMNMNRPSLDSITRPINDALSQNRLPDLNQMGQNLQRTTSDLGNRLRGTIDNALQNGRNNLPNMQGMNTPSMNQHSNPLDSITRPITDALSQNRLPDLNQMGQNLQRTTSDLGNSLQGTLNNGANQLGGR